MDPDRSGPRRRWFDRLRRLAGARRDATPVMATNPPIELIAADLRRLLWEHHIQTLTIAGSPGIAAHVRRRRELEIAISERATQAARALGVPYPHYLAHSDFDRPVLRRLLRTLAVAGLVLPPAVELLAPDSSF
jgi:sugar phosphate isomerase/epimerase